MNETQNKKFKIAEREDKIKLLIKQKNFIKEVMEKMAEENLTMREAELFTDELAKEVKRNNERLRNEGPFVINK